MVNLSDGTLRYGEVIDAGGFFSSGIEVRVEMDNGEAGFSKVEALDRLFVPTKVHSVTVAGACVSLVAWAGAWWMCATSAVS